MKCRHCDREPEYIEIDEKAKTAWCYCSKHGFFSPDRPFWEHNNRALLKLKPRQGLVTENLIWFKTGNQPIENSDITEIERK